MSYFIDYAWASLNKKGEELCGDRVETYRNENECIVVLSDGLGSGVKANILSTLTSKIAITMLKEGLSIQEVVETVTHTLPVCKVRELAYSTFTIVKIDRYGKTYIVEFDNPNVFYVKKNKVQEIQSKYLEVNGKKIKESTLSLEEGDALVFLSDGAIHAGFGNLINLGWGWEEVGEFIEGLPHHRLNAKDITNKVIEACNTLYMEEVGDDTTVVTIKVMRPKQITLFSGPPKNQERDVELVKEFFSGRGKRIICGGTAGKIVARESGESIIPLNSSLDKNIPPMSRIKGVDLVTEGVLTIRGAIDILNRINTSLDLSFLYENNGASNLARMLFEDCTEVKMLVGKGVNEAHQDEDFPEELNGKEKLILELKEALEGVSRKVQIIYY